ncbi:MAG TPA: lipoyl synthase [Patescibacteria group bacterium]|nr:lipoyl synthase [Patescibacteria group bacterium]
MAKQEWPSWLTLPVPEEAALVKMKELLDTGSLHTVCESADCPNLGECFKNRTCTFLILGDHCTRDCRFCAVPYGRPAAVDAAEPQLVAATAAQLELRHVVVTSVSRDDLPDGGAGHFVATIRALRQQLPQAVVEVLIPDFQGDHDALALVMAARPDIVNHNMETVPRLYPAVRPQAVYSRSLELIARVRRLADGIRTKSGLMLGLGEAKKEIFDVLVHLRQAGCEMLTLGQYLRPSVHHLPVAEYVSPDVFARWKMEALAMGFQQVNAGPLVRSSYQAELSWQKMMTDQR